ncbi:MAG: hypothetical protein KF795_00750 [Labilithrix sp.]|nr:hypothetical protein [Labilithrix sp.]
MAFARTAITAPTSVRSFVTRAPPSRVARPLGDSQSLAGLDTPSCSTRIAPRNRIAQHCHVIDIDADSWRHKAALKRGKGRKPKTDE